MIEQVLYNLDLSKRWGSLLSRPTGAHVFTIVAFYSEP